MRAAHICAGLGGSLWTGAILGWEADYALDHDPYRCAALRAQADAGWWPGLRVDCADLACWDPPDLDRPVDIVAAGFSCKDISCAGGRAGLDGASTGPTYRGCLQAIDHFRPSYAFFENSPRIKPYRPTIWADLESRGYHPADGTIDAAMVGAPHQRERWYMLATRSDVDGQRQPQPPGSERTKRGRSGDLVQCAGTDAARCRRDEGADQVCQRRTIAGDVLQEPASDPVRNGQQEPIQRRWIPGAGGAAIEAAARYCGAHHWNPPDASLCGVVDGMAHPRGARSRYIAGLGDAWVPAQAVMAWLLLGGPTIDAAAAAGGDRDGQEG